MVSMNVIDQLRSRSFHTHSNLHWEDASTTRSVIGGIQSDGSFLFRETGCNTHVRLIIDGLRAVYQPDWSWFTSGNVDCWDNRPPVGTALREIIPDHLNQGMGWDDSQA
jgi:hypothetical protein